MHKTNKSYAYETQKNALPLEIPASRTSIAPFIQQWGNHASLAVFDPACIIFSVPEIHGIIGYRLELNTAIAFGDPICAPQDILALTKAFHAFCARHKRNVIYIAVSESFVNWSLQHECRSTIQIGNEIILDPFFDPREGMGSKASLLRRKYHQAQREGITFHEYTTPHEATEKAMESVGLAWLKNRKGPQIYLYHVNIFDDRAHKRWFYALHNNTIVGIVVLNRLDYSQGWVLNALMLTSDAPPSTSEFLILSTLEILGVEGCRFFSIGNKTIDELGRMEGFGKLSMWLARKGFRIAQKIFKLGDQQRYWKKFKPRTAPTFALFNQSRINARSVRAIMRALNVHV